MGSWIVADKLNIDILPDLGLNPRDKAMVGSELREPSGSGEGFEVTFRRALAAVGVGKGGNKLPQEFVRFTVEDVESIPLHEKKLTGETSVLLGDTDIDTDAVVVFAALQGMQPDAIKALFEKPTPDVFEKTAKIDLHKTTTEHITDLKTLPTGTVEETFKQLKEHGIIAGQHAAKEHGMITGQHAAKEHGMITGQHAAKEHGMVTGHRGDSKDSSLHTSRLTEEVSRPIQNSIDRLPFEAKIRRSTQKVGEESKISKSQALLRDLEKDSYVTRRDAPNNRDILNVSALQNAQRQGIPQPADIGSAVIKSDTQIGTDLRDNRPLGSEMIHVGRMPGTFKRTLQTQVVEPQKDVAIEGPKVSLGIDASKVRLEESTGFRISATPGREKQSAGDVTEESRVNRVRDTLISTQQKPMGHSVTADYSNDLERKITESHTVANVSSEGNKDQMLSGKKRNVFREGDKIPVAPILTRDDMVVHRTRANMGMDTVNKVNQSITGVGLEVTNTADRLGHGDVSSAKESANNQQPLRGGAVAIEEVPVRVAAMVQQRLAGGLPQERWSYQLQLQPRELGNVTVELEMLDGHLEARLIATNIGAKELLGDNLTKLDEAFQNAGLKDNAIHVTIDNRDQSDKKGQRADAEGQADQKEDEAERETAEKQGFDGSYDNGNLDVLV